MHNRNFAFLSEVRQPPIDFDHQFKHGFELKGALKHRSYQSILPRYSRINLQIMLEASKKEMHELHELRLKNAGL